MALAGMPDSMRRGFHHEAVFYAGDEEYRAGLLPDLRAALDTGGAILVTVGEDKGALLRAALGEDAGRVRFADMEQLGRNPACIIPAWREFLATAGSGPRLGVGEPVWPGRSEAELIECRRHESLLNLAFDGGGPWRLLCPYDVRALPPDVLADARHNHPHVSRSGVSEPCADYVDPPTVLSWDGALPAPAADPAELRFTRDDLALVRAFVSERAARAGFGAERLSDLVLAVNELATNAMRHGGGRGLVRVWQENGTFLCEVADRGRIADALAGRERAPDARGGGRGLWLVNHLCDLVQVRSLRTGNVIRVHMSLDGAP
jgi:anti-sigma regulatory factor (Ser/Thr protein kinase)